MASESYGTSRAFPVAKRIVPYILNQHTVAVGEFSDAEGDQWRVWSVDPDEMHPTTRAEAFTADLADGWLVFERVDGSEKRRLCPIPHRWEQAGADELQAMLRRAGSVVRRKPPAPAAATLEETTVTGRAPAVSPSSSSVLRSFRYPGGRLWTAGLYHPPSGGPPILRFMAGGRTVDLDAWPADWSAFDDRQLSELLRLADQRTPGTDSGAGGLHLRRRHRDRRP
ncbi:MAG: hypothetical protein NVS4B3_12150 [Gemmatimonadaceae bacterium]